MTTIRLNVNGRDLTLDVSPRTNLSDALRDHLNLTGTHVGCEHGICGACTVEIDGQIARSCITYAVTVDGARVRSIEGFDDDATMARLRQAFSAHHALQCGYCTPGMLVAARDLVARKQGLTREEIRHEMSGNLCRCTGYVGIVSAIEEVMREGVATTATPTAGVDGTWLGPAPGPAGDKAGAFAKVAAASALANRPVANPHAPPAPRPSRASRKDIPVTVGPMREAGGMTWLSQSFALPHPRNEVWALLQDTERLAACMPGAALEGPLEDDRFKGRMEVMLGPIAARFAGHGTIRSDPAAFRQEIAGEGGDRGSGSRAKGEILVELKERDSAHTEVAVEIGYALTGPLAQFSRSGLVRDLVQRIAKAFAANMDAELAAPGQAKIAPARLSGGGLLWAAIKAWLSRLVGRG